MKLGTVEFVFENGEVISIPGKYFLDFYIDNINTYFKRTTANTIEKIDEAGTIALSIHRNADKEYHSFGLSAYKTTKFDRILAYNNIVFISFFLDDKKYSYRIKWDNDIMSENLNQASQKSRFGHLYLVISDNVWTDMKKYFSEEMINDKDYEFD